MERYALFGTHGAGKSSIVHALEHLGEAVVHEAAPALRRLAEAHGDPHPEDKPDFESRVLRLHRQREASVPPSAPRVFIDRGAPDHLAYSHIGRWPLSDEEVAFCLAPRYRVALLVEPPPRGVPTVTRAEATFSARQVREAETLYRQIGIPVIRVPYGPCDQRVRFVIDQVTAASATLAGGLGDIADLAVQQSGRTGP